MAQSFGVDNKRVKAKTRGPKETKPEWPALIKQEWLFEPRYIVTVCLPEKYHAEFASRVRECRWHYSPCMGLSEMAARLELVDEGTVTALPEGSEVSCASVARREGTVLNGRRMIEESGNGESLAILTQRMPREVTEDRVFTHADYLIERSGLPISLKTDSAYEVRTGDPETTKTVIFL